MQVLVCVMFAESRCANLMFAFESHCDVFLSRIASIPRSVSAPEIPLMHAMQQYNYTALAAAIYGGQIDCVRLLLESGANMEARTDVRSQTSAKFSACVSILGSSTLH